MIIYDPADPDDHADHDDPSETTLPFLLDHSVVIFSCPDESLTAQ